MPLDLPDNLIYIDSSGNLHLKFDHTVEITLLDLYKYILSKYGKEEEIVGKTT